jgi:hypothetical protein
VRGASLFLLLRWLDGILCGIMLVICSSNFLGEKKEPNTRTFASAELDRFGHYV